MRLSHSLILAGALLAATPALAQDANTTTDNAMMANGVDMNASAPAIAADNMAAGDVSAPPSVATPADTGTTMAVKQKKGFPFGVLGLIGLIGLLGVRKVKS